MSDLFQDAVKMEDETAIAVVPEENNSLLMEAVKKGLDAESIKMLVELANKQEDRKHKEQFDEAFSKMQSSFPPIVKGKAALNRDGSTMYKYAPLEELQTICNPIISRHGFSYSWAEEAVNGCKRTVLTISGFGHDRSNYFDAPQINGTERTNPIQVAGIQSTYGKRYTFISGFGLTVAGEDSDGAIPISEDTLVMDLREMVTSSKLTPQNIATIKAQLDKPEGERDMEKLRIYWKKAKAKVEK